MAAHNDISIRLRPNGISFSICEKTGKELFSNTIDVNNRSETDAIRETILSSGILEKTYNKVTIVVPSPLFALFPEEVFDPKQIEFYYKSIVEIPNGKHLLFQHLKEFGMFLLFAVEEELYDFLVRSFIHPEIEHHLLSLLYSLEAHSSSREGNALYVAYDTQLLSLILFKKNRFHAASVFECTTQNDALYYILSMWRQFKYNQLDDTLYIIGEGTFQDELFGEASLYVRQAERL